MISKVSELAEKINFMTQLSSFPHLSALELDLLMQHLRELYAELDAIRHPKTNSAKNQPVKDIVTEPAIEITKNIPEIKTPLQEFETKNAEPVSLPITDVKSLEKEPVTNKESRTSLQERSNSAFSLNEKLKVNAPEIHDKLSSKSLRELIDFNKRFAIVNELFNGDTNLFAEALTQIDNAQTFSEADNYTQNELAKNLGWDTNSQSCKLFMKLVKQKFGVE